ncbi:MAG: TIGR03915 family putative DNA repair protein [Maledivibacter sp.]|jgi:probable DNA metabolism protein|nr:TIGR03915 family putative DNA repair protein [Maledivibacter sp.]
MIHYIYDGSFDGLLTSIYEAYYRKDIPEKILFNKDPQENLLVNRIHISTDIGKSKKVYDSIKNKISSRALKNIFYTYLSEEENLGTWVYKYLRLGWKIGKNVDLNMSDDGVLKIYKTRRSVEREVHLLTGLIRFRRLEANIYYAPVEPMYNTVGLLAPHFAERLGDQNWVIHDVKRGIGAVYNKEEWIISDINFKHDLKFGEDETFFQNLWREYFKSVAIKNRINPKLQKKNMPMRYWRYLVEKN